MDSKQQPTNLVQPLVQWAKTGFGVFGKCFKRMLFLLSCWLLVSGYLAQASGDEEYLIDSWQTEQGLPENSATAMVQTRDGFLWFGTFKGLVRFDGFNFKILDSSNTPSLPSSGIVNLHLDQTGRLWVSTYRGLVSVLDGKWTAYPNEAGWTGDYVRTFAERSGVLCLTSFDGKIFEFRNGHLTQLPEPGGTKGASYFGHVDQSGRVWAAQAGFLSFWNGQRWVAPEFATKVADKLMWGGTDSQGNLIVLNAARIIRIKDGAILSETRFSQPVPPTWRVDEDSEGNLWVSSFTAGLSRIRKDGSVKRYMAVDGLTYESLRFAFEDREHNLWVGSSGGGLMRFKKRTFMTYSMEHGLPDRNIKGIIEDGPGHYLIATYGKGLGALRNGKPEVIPGVNLETAPKYIQCMLRDSVGRTWVGTYATGLHQLDQGGFHLVPEAGQPIGGVTALMEDSKGNVWIGSGEWVRVLLKSGTKVEAAKGSTQPSGCRFFAENPVDKSIWASGFDSLFRFDAAGWKEIKRPDGTSIKDTICMKFDADGTLWLGGTGTGLMRLKGGNWATLSVSHGLPSLDISCILDDKLGDRWIGSNRGIMKARREDFDKVADGILSKLPNNLFNLSDGLASVECTSGFQNTGLTDGGGRLWFATLKGVATVNPAQIQLNTIPPSIFIDQVRVADINGRQSFLPGIETNEVRLLPGMREVVFFISVLSYSAPEKVKLAYFLEGANKDWVEMGNRRSLYFYPPPPGHYSLKIKAANNDGVWNDTGIQLAFVVQPFYWQTIWFRGGLLCLLLFASSVAVWRIGRARLHLKIERLEQQKILVQERARLASVLEATSDLVGFADADRKVKYLNPAGRRMLGFKPEEDLQLVEIADYFPPWALHQIRSEAIPQAMRDGLWSGETTLRHRDGREIPVLQVIVAHKNPDGSLDFLSTVAKDITDRKHSELMLKANEAQLQQVLDNLPAAAYTCDEKGLITYFNRKAQLLWLRSPRLRHVQDRFCGSIRMFNSAGQPVPHEESWVAQALATRRPIESNESRIERPDGSRRIVLVNASPLMDGTGELIGSVNVLTDITEAEAAKQALGASEALLRQFIMHTPAAVAMFDMEMRYIQASDRWILDYRLLGQPLIGRSHYDVFPDVPERWKTVHKRALGGSVECCEEDPFERADGTVQWLQWEVRPWLKVGGEVGGVIMFTQVITERKLAEQKIAEQLSELRRWQKLTLDREDRLQQLKREVNELMARLGDPAKYLSQVAGQSPVAATEVWIKEPGAT